ncbi:MAG: hypothetical protein JJU28_13520 [Cyclobacteriaceae bacterium]|nr:hypothetical protein [Cyclobacteriaceae bacterium]
MLNLINPSPVTNFSLNDFMESFADELGGQFSEYDKKKSVIIVPLHNNRFQAVLGVLRVNPKFNKTSVEFSSKVCHCSNVKDYKALVQDNAKTAYAKFVLIDDYLKVEGSAFLENVSKEALKDIILEVANLADEWEQKLTGLDVH